MENTACEGMARLQNLKVDFYEFDEKNLRLVGRKTGRTITFGDKVKVKVIGTDLEKRTIDLELILPPGKYGNTLIKQPSRGRRR
jgi:ribonuclease R